MNLIRNLHRTLRPFSPPTIYRSMAINYLSSVSKLQGPTKLLVEGITEQGSIHTGNSDTDKTQVAEWIEKVAQGDIIADLKVLNTQLVPRTYIVKNYFTAADAALFGALHPVLATLQPPQYYAHPALVRYFDHIQSRTPIRTAADALNPPLSTLVFDIDNAPVLERSVEPPKRKEKAPKAVVVEEKALPVPPATPAETTDAKPQKKEKKEKKPAPTKPAAPVDEEPAPSMIDLRVGRIVDIMKHPDADGLYVEQIDIGEETGPRTVVSGLVHYIPIEQMRDQYLIAVCNLKPANMRGVKSFAMVLCATSKDGKEAGIELIKPPANSKPGDRVYFDGAEFENATPLAQLNPKKKIFETVQPGFITLDSKEAAWVNPITKSVHKIRTSAGVCLAPTLIGASLS